MPTKTLVWRIQNKKGYGPYNNARDRAVEDVLRSHSFSTARPAWCRAFELGDISFIPADRSGFMTLCQLLKWFTPYERKVLRKYGYNPVLIKGRIIFSTPISGLPQIIFRKL